MTDPSIADPPSPYSPMLAAKPAPPAARPVAARTKLLLEGPVFATLLRLAAPNILNLVAFVAVIIFDGFFLGQDRNGRARRRLTGVSLDHAGAANHQQRYGRRGVIRRRARARSGKSRAGRRAGVPRIAAGSCAWRDLLDGDAARRALAVRLDGRPRQDAAGRAVIRERGLRRRGLHHRAQSAWQRSAGNGQHEPACRRAGRLRDRAHRTRACFDVRIWTVSGDGACGCRLGAGDSFRHRQPHHDRSTCARRARLFV